MKRHVAALSALVAFVACVGDDPKPTAAADGALGGRCFSNGSCNPTLTCSAGVCLGDSDGGTTSGGTSGTSGTSGGTPTNDGGPTACAATLTPQTEGAVLCGASSCGPAGSAWCCSLGSGVECGVACDAPDTRWNCTSALQCGAGKRCCMGGAATEARPDECPPRAIKTVLVTTCDDDCQDSERLCSSDADCSPTHTCAPTSFRMGNDPVTLGTCAPKP